MPSTVSNDASTIIPLLFAAHPTLVPDYRRMAAMDDIGRTQAALEHKFRTWRQDGKKIAAAKGDTEGMKSVTKKAVSTTKVAGEKKAPRTVLSRSLKTAKEVEDESGETGDDADEAQPNAKSKASNAGSLKLDSNKHDSTPNAQNNVANTSVPVSKKRPAATSANDTGKSIKKARITKKGTAQKVHRPARKPRETEEEVTSSEEEEAEQKTKPTKKTLRARGNAISGPSSPMITEKVEEEVKTEGVQDGLVEMGFDYGV